MNVHEARLRIVVRALHLFHTVEVQIDEGQRSWIRCSRPRRSDSEVIGVELSLEASDLQSHEAVEMQLSRLEQRLPTLGTRRAET